MIRFELKKKKNNSNQITRSMRDFGTFVDSLDLWERPLTNGRNTWTNSHEIPTPSRLDRFLASLVWEEQYPHFYQETHPRLTYLTIGQFCST